MRYPPQESDNTGNQIEQEYATDFASLTAAPVSMERRASSHAPTDFGSLKQGMPDARKPYQSHSATDHLIDFLTPFMILVMVASIISFLLDVRYVYTEVHSANLRAVALLFVLGVVALNRLVARDGTEESIVYIFGLAAAIGLYTFVTTGMYDVGSVARGFLNKPYIATAFNMCVVAFVWWFTNRLMHECCVDENLTAGDIGILTGTARRVLTLTRQRPQAAPKVKRRKDGDPFVYMNIEPYDPTEHRESERTVQPQAPPKRLPKRHPGISIFYFSVPAILLFALGPRVIQHGGQWLVISGYFYLGCFSVAALALLMLTSLAGLRAYFRNRRVTIPSGIGPFWLGLGTVFVAMVLLGAAALPMPSWPTAIHIDKHEYDPWQKGSTFKLESIAATPVQILEQTRFMQRAGTVVLACLGLFIAYGLIRLIGAAAFAIARRRGRFPKWVVRFFDALDRLLLRLARLPSLPSFQRRHTVAREHSLCARFRNPLASIDPTGHVNVADVLETSYAALCALARDLGVPRRDDQTPYEFIDSFPEPLESLREEAVELTNLYVQSSYSDEALDQDTLNRLRKFWFNFERVRSRVVR